MRVWPLNEAARLILLRFCDPAISARCHTGRPRNICRCRLIRFGFSDSCLWPWVNCFVFPAPPANRNDTVNSGACGFCLCLYVKWCSYFYWITQIHVFFKNVCLGIIKDEMCAYVTSHRVLQEYVKNTGEMGFLSFLPWRMERWKRMRSSSHLLICSKCTQLYPHRSQWIEISILLFPQMEILL